MDRKGETEMSSIKDKMKHFAVNQALQYVEGDPEVNIPKLMDLADKFTPEGWYEGQRKSIRTVIEEKNNRVLEVRTTGIS